MEEPPWNLRDSTGQVLLVVCSQSICGKLSFLTKDPRLLSRQAGFSEGTAGLERYTLSIGTTSRQLGLSGGVTDEKQDVSTS